VISAGPESVSVSSRESGFRLKLPATSANLGPGFDTLALALALYLEIDAQPADAFAIEASGRNVDLCQRLEGNLLLQVYRETVRTWAAREAPPLRLLMRNGIPLGMGCGSSAASRLAAVALAAHFGELGWSRERILDEASHLEGHPDNAAACWLGGFAASGWGEPVSGNPVGARTIGTGEGHSGLEDRRSVAAISLTPPSEWHALLVLPAAPLATTTSRAVLPDHYSRRDTVLNLQRVALLTAAFASGRGELLRAATGDSLHQPYRAAVCPLLPTLLPLAGRGGILSVTLSGAGPAVLLLLASDQAEKDASGMVLECVGARAPGAGIAEIIDCPLAPQPALAACV
jgi:homoserine kinase